MRFLREGPSIPDELLFARDEGRVVFFCGAGVSRARAGLPDFFGLADDVITRLRVPPDHPARKILIEARDMETRTGVSGLISADHVFGLLERDFQVADVELTDPTGATFSSGVTLPILDAPNRQIVVKDPAPGQWLLEARGVRGLAAVPNFSLPTSGAAAPGPIDGTITQQQFTLATIPDIQGHPAQAQIESVIKNRMMDTFPDGAFRPDSNVTRRDFAQALVLSTSLRQSVAATRRFTDVTGNLEQIAEAVTADGSTLRDWNFTPQGMMSANGSSFNPGGLISRLNMAVALVRALGLDAQARALAGTNITVLSNGETLVLADNADIPAAVRGYAQIALDKQILQAFFSLEQGPFDFQPTLKARVKPNNPSTRAFLSFGLDHFRQHFASGN